MDFTQHLNPSQLTAVTTIDRPILVIAGAGSGKTRVIEYKVLHLLANNFDPSQILLLTFTRKASHEMLTRISTHDPRCQRIDGGTFHSFAFKILKKYAARIGLANNFTILDTTDATELLDRAMSQLHLHDIKKRFPKKQTLLSIISQKVNKQTSILNILEEEYPQFAEFDHEIKNLASTYARLKLNSNYVDYDDLLIYLRLLLQNNQIRDQITRRYNYIMVDEYQDTNKIQGDITYLLSESHGKIMVVGDDAQTIYGFRGANHQNIMDFPQLFPNCQIIKLEQNYRSTQKILDISNAVLSNMEKKFDKKLTSASDSEGLTPELIAFKNPYEEAEWIANEIKRLRDDGLNLSDQAVLFRSAYISIPLQAELGKLNIPFRVYGGMKFYETAHVKDMISFLKIIANPYDELAWSRSLKLIEGIGPVTVTKITSSFESSLSFAQILDTIEAQFIKTNFKYSTDLAKLIKAFRTIDFETDTVSNAYKKIFKYYQPILKTTYDEWPTREDDLYTLSAIAESYTTLVQFLADLALEPPQQGVYKGSGEIEDETPLTLSTIHSAKGLEWDAVFLLGVVDGILPSRFSLNKSDQLEEERRLFYVAITRAKKYLYLTMHHEGSYGGMSMFNRLSRFIENSNVLAHLEQKLINLNVGNADLRSLPNTFKFNSKLIGNQLDNLKKLSKEELFKKINESWK